MTDGQLAAEIERLLEVRFRSGQLHTLAIQPHFQGMALLIATYKELLGDSDSSASDGTSLAALRLVQGYPDKSFESGERLWRVARVAAALPRVAERLRALERSAALDTLSALRGEPSAAPFVEAFDAYLDAYGWRSNASFGTPTWAEEPTVPLMLLRAYLEAGGYDPNAQQQRLGEEREAALREALAALDADGRARLEDVLDAAVAVSPQLEDHNFFIDQRLACMPRRLVLAAGHRLVAKGVLDDPARVFFLRVRELLDALAGSAAGLSETAWRRKEELAYWRAVTPPPFVGAPPPEGAPSGLPPAPRDGSGELRGSGVSAGVARGPARIVRSLAEADRLRPGDVLVTSVTQPAWTPLFGIASAIVTEVGGMLSHTAIASREYGLPAVVALRDAMRRIPDGRLIEVDGSAGTVQVIG
jgi:pyruvate,water dikinase